jgi:hypothetical protein
MKATAAFATVLPLPRFQFRRAARQAERAEPVHVPPERSPEQMEWWLAREVDPLIVAAAMYRLLGR